MTDHEAHEIRRQLENRARSKMELSFTERVSRAQKGEPDMLTKEEIERIQNSSCWTSGMNRAPRR